MTTEIDPPMPEVMPPAPMLALWHKHPGDVLGQTINFLTHGDYEHAGIWRPDIQKVHELYLPQIRERDRVTGETFDVFTIDDITDDEIWMFYKWMNFYNKHPLNYSIEDLFKYEFNVPFPTDQSAFCSAYVAILCQKSLTPGHQIMRRIHPDNVPPVQISYSAKISDAPFPPA